MTAVLVHCLAVIRRDVRGIPADPDKCAAAALFHDASEIFTGDLPTPVKYFNPDIKASYKEVERISKDKLIRTLPAELIPAYAPLINEDMDACTRELVKAADKLSAYIKCVEELAGGNNEFKKAAEQTRDALNAMALPEVAYFLENFMHSFTLTIDELE
jgi:5'-deoxynucleotidase